MAKYQYNGADIVTPFTIFSNQPVYEVETVSLKLQRASQGYQRWELVFTTVEDSSTQVDSFLSQLTQFDTDQTMVMPQFDKPLSEFTATGNTPGIAVAASAGDTSVWVDSSTVDGVIPKGMFFKFNNHDKVYVTTNSIDLAGGLSRELEFYPSLRTSVGLVNTLELDTDCLITYKQSLDNQTGITFTDGLLSSMGTITLIEAV